MCDEYGPPLPQHVPLPGRLYDPRTLKAVACEPGFAIPNGPTPGANVGQTSGEPGEPRKG